MCHQVELALVINIRSPCTQNVQRSRTTSGLLVVPAEVHLQQRQTVTYILPRLNVGNQRKRNGESPYDMEDLFEQRYQVYIFDTYYAMVANN